ncbi:MAG: tRNA (adenosine(37)-N6)-dimethylallyltransferase MiaA [Pseudomonadota bacterium]
MADSNPNERSGEPLVVIGGPTASGKSPLAMDLAEMVGGEIINGDSMQVYDELRLLTARPGPDDERRVPHHLYGFMSVTERCSVALWADAARRVVTDCLTRGSVPIIVGGTGLYLATFMRGLSPIPDVPASVRSDVMARVDGFTAQELHDLARAVDPDLAQRIPVGDAQRLIRLLEVHEATGEPLSAWQQQPRRNAWPGPVLFLVLRPDRAVLYQACNERFDAMMAAGALQEVAALTDRDLSPDLPAMRALGVPPLLAHIRGEMAVDEAVQTAKTATRRYAKRQLTWFRHQAGDAIVLDDQDAAERLACARAHISGFLLTAKGPKA